MTWKDPGKVAEYVGLAMCTVGRVLVDPPGAAGLRSSSARRRAPTLRSGGAEEVPPVAGDVDEHRDPSVGLVRGAR